MQFFVLQFKSFIAAYPQKTYYNNNEGFYEQDLKPDWCKSPGHKCYKNEKRRST